MVKCFSIFLSWNYSALLFLCRKRVYPLSDSREDDSSFLDSLPSVKKSR